MEAKFTAAVIGLGQIGLGYDYDQSDATRIATHSRAFSLHPGFELIAGVDPDIAARERFTKKFDRPAYAEVHELLTRHRPEVLSLALPTSLHLPTFAECAHSKPRAVICEKPITPTLTEAQELLKLARLSGISVLVNYMRRFDPGVAQLKALLEAGFLGRPYKATAWYTKGLLHNGSHLVDLFRFLFGEATGKGQIVRTERLWNGTDPELDALIPIGGVECYFLAAREEYFSLAEAEIICTGGLIRYSASGKRIEYQRAGEEKSEILENDLPRYQWHVVDALYRHLTAGAPLVSTGETATATLEVVEGVTKELRVAP